MRRDMLPDDVKRPQQLGRELTLPDLTVDLPRNPCHDELLRQPGRQKVGRELRRRETADVASAALRLADPDRHHYQWRRAGEHPDQNLGAVHQHVCEPYLG